MTRLGARTLAGAVLVGALTVAAGAGGASAAPADPGAYRTAPGAERAQGGASTATAGALAVGGTYEDSLGPAEERFYRLELDADSSVYVSATVLPGPGAAVSYADGIDVVLMSTGGRECTTAGQAGFAADQARPLAAVAVRRLQEDGECQTAGPYYVKVTRSTGKESDRGRWPMELRVMREPARAGGNAPAAGPTAYPSAPVAAPAGTPVPRAGGTGFNDARALAAGVWRDDLVPGQTRFYRVPVDWGQQLDLSVELSGARMTKTSGYASNGLVAEVYNPVRGQVADKSGFYDGKQLSLALGPLAPVRYENRFSDVRAIRPLRAAGWHYVAVTLHRKVGEFTTGSVPVLLRVGLEGTRAEGPGYAEPDAAAAGFGVTPADLRAAAEGQTAAEATAAADDRAVLRVVAAGGIGTGTVLLLGLGAWTLLARRRPAGG
ncbi:hypothetical protein [Streptomyces sp. NPDC089919]|uniref:hypothetical protein n=1 Tax=Streptomyces sp. NPDC089919 TaxID=3155188 RepID=UPI0034168333